MLLQAKNPLLRRSTGGITFVGSASDTTTNGGTNTITLPGGIAQNDIIVTACHSTGGTVATPSGYTLVHNDSNINGTVNQGGVFYKVQTATPDTSISFWDSGGTSEATSAVAFIFRGVDTGTPLDGVTPGEAEGAQSGVNGPSVTPNSNNACVVVVNMNNHTAAPTAGPTDYTTPTIWSVLGDDTNDSTCAMAYRILVGGEGASEDPGGFTTGGGSGSSDAYAVTLVLRPAT